MNLAGKLICFCNLIDACVKKIKYKNDDDDDFVVVPYRARTKYANTTSTNSDVEEVTDQMRISTKWLVDAIKNLNARQRRVMEEIGFVNLFHLKVDAVVEMTCCVVDFEQYLDSRELC